MDKNTIIGFILMILIFIGVGVYSNVRSNKGFKNAVTAAESEVAKGNLEQAKTEYFLALRFRPNRPDITAKIEEINQKLGVTPDSQIKDTLKVKPGSENIAPVTPKSVPKDGSQYGEFANAAKGDDGFITLENNKLELKISLKGGRVYSARLKDYVTYDSLPLVLFSGDSTVFGFNFFTADNIVIQTNNLYFKPVSDEKSFVVTSEPLSVSLRLHATDEQYIEYKYTLAPDKYSLSFEVTLKNLENIFPPNQNNISLEWKMYIPQQEKGRQNEERYTSIKYKLYQDEVTGLRLRSKKELEKVDINAKLSWVAFEDQFFSSVIIADDLFSNGSVSSTILPSGKYTRYFTSDVGVPFTPGAESKIGMRLYLGPNHISTLRKEGFQLEKLVNLGRSLIGWISRFVIIPVFNWLNKYIRNYGIIILILTILIKIVLFPLTFKSYQSTAKMAVLKPMVDEIGKKFPKKEDSVKKQQATMDLYKRAGVNPMGGCLPMLLQFPILFAMFRFFPVSIELRQQHFLWATDLSTYDSILNFSFNIPLVGNHLSLFTLLMTGSSFLTMKMSGSSPTPDQPGMKMMQYMMPIMFMFMFNNFPSGLTYYYFLANMLTWIQNIISKRFIDADKVLATLEANKKKPVPKSKWQQRLEAAAKQRGVNPSRK